MGYLQPDLDFFATTRVLSQEMAPLRYGVGSWMAGAVRRHDGIAVYHSLAAALAPRAIPGTFEEQCELAHRGLQGALADLGVQYNYVTEQQVLAGALERGEYRVILLPQTHALHPQAAQALAAFARRGGRVLADTLPGRFDHHLAPQDRPLDGLFAGAGGVLLQGDLPGYDQPAGDAPDKRYGPEGAALRAELAGALAQAGVACPVRLEVGKGPVPPRVELVRWGRGDTELLGIFHYPRDFNDGAPASPALALRVRLPQARYCRVLGEAALGKPVSELTVRVEQGKARFIATSPRPLAPLRLQAPSAVMPGEDFTLALQSPDGQARPARLELVTPQGQPAPWVEGELVVEGTRTVRLRAAYNDPPGRWQVRVTDWFAGRVISAPMEMGGR